MAICKCDFGIDGISTRPFNENSLYGTQWATPVYLAINYHRSISRQHEII